jgi:hypothetical protein
VKFIRTGRPFDFLLAVVTVLRDCVTGELRLERMVFGEQSFAGTSCASDAAGSQHATVHNALSTSSSRRAAIDTPDPRTRAIIDPGPFFRYPDRSRSALRTPITSTNTNAQDA